MEDIELLKKSIFFRDLTKGELLKIQLLAEQVSFGPGQEIMKEGTACDALFIIRKGTVKIFKSGSHLESLGPGEPIGEIAFIDKGLRSATLSAHDEVELLKIPAEAFETIMERDRELAVKVYKSIVLILCQRLREASEALRIIPDYVKHLSDL